MPVPDSSIGIGPLTYVAPLLSWITHIRPTDPQSAFRQAIRANMPNRTSNVEALSE